MFLLKLCLLFWSFFVLICLYYFFFFKQKTAYEMRISDWSSDVCSSDLRCRDGAFIGVDRARPIPARGRDLAKPGLGRSAVRPLGERQVNAFCLLQQASAQQAIGTKQTRALVVRKAAVVIVQIGKRRMAFPVLGRASGRERGGQYVLYSGV